MDDQGSVLPSVTAGADVVRKAYADAHETLISASCRVDSAALAYGEARLKRNYPALNRLTKDLKEAAFALAKAVEESKR